MAVVSTANAESCSVTCGNGTSCAVGSNKHPEQKSEGLTYLEYSTGLDGVGTVNYRFEFTAKESKNMDKQDYLNLQDFVDQQFARGETFSQIESAMAKNATKLVRCYCSPSSPQAQCSR